MSDHQSYVGGRGTWRCVLCTHCVSCRTNTPGEVREGGGEGGEGERDVEWRSVTEGGREDNLKQRWEGGGIVLG